MNQESMPDVTADCRQAEPGAEWSDTLPMLFRSEGFFEDLLPEPAPEPWCARPSRRAAGRPRVLSQMFASMLRMRSA